MSRKIGHFYLIHDLTTHAPVRTAYLKIMKNDEKIKLDKNIQIAKDTNKDFLYLSEYNSIGYVHNVSKLVEKNYDFKSGDFFLD